MLLVLATCGGSREIKEARRSVYDTDFAVVYASTLDVVRDEYPNLTEDPAKGRISTAWKQVQYSDPGAEDPKSQQNANQALGYDPTGTSATTANSTLTTPTSLAYKRFFIRFDVSISGGRPWRIRVVGHASEWEPGNALPSELRGAATPHWLPGRTEGLQVAIYKKLRPYAVLTEDEDIKAPPDGPPPVDVTAYGPIPPDAGKRAGELRRAITIRDYDALRTQVASDVMWSLGGGPGIDAALATWQADPAILEAMGTAIDAGCRGDDKEITCPPAVSETPGYTGWRLTIAHRPEGWLVTSFLQGD